MRTSCSLTGWVLRTLLVLALTHCIGTAQQTEPLSVSWASFQTQAQQEADRITRPRSEPYKGDLSIFEDPNRDQKLQIDRVMDLLGIAEGSSVADIGAGSGWFTVRAARRIGPRGVVYAVEINPAYLKHIEARAAREKLSNIRTVLGKEDDPVLPPQSVDAVLILKTYHEIGEPIRLLARLAHAMRPNARLGIIDRNGKGDDHGISKAIVIKEAGQAGFYLLEEYDFVKPDGMDYFLVLRVRDGRASRTDGFEHPVWVLSQ